MRDDPIKLVKACKRGGRAGSCDVGSGETFASELFQMLAGGSKRWKIGFASEVGDAEEKLIGKLEHLVGVELLFALSVKDND